MESKREAAWVGFFVLVAAGLLIVTVFILSGTLGPGTVHYRAYFKNAGGLAPGAEVRYAGGPAVGHVEKVMADPQNSTRMEVDFSVDPKVPVKTDSIAEVTSVSPLGDNFLGILPGTLQAPKAPPDSVLPGKEFTSLADIAEMLSKLEPKAETLLDNVNDRVIALKETMDRVNDVLNDRNRANISGTLANLNGMLAENRPLVHTTLTNVNAMSAKLNPLIDDFRKTAQQADDTLAHLDATIGENRADLHQAVLQLRETLHSTVALTAQLNNTLSTNTENLDEIIDNLRHVTENLNAFTETIETRPYTLIRASGVKPHAPGSASPK
jgi:phospholipid/cholesterol/gamma-HCH transport system substrate-binding protein